MYLLYLTVTKELRYRKEGKGSKNGGQYDALFLECFCLHHFIWSCILCILWSCYYLLTWKLYDLLLASQFDHQILSWVCRGKLFVITLERLLLKKLSLNKLWINSRLCGKELSTVGVGYLWVPSWKQWDFIWPLKGRWTLGKAQTGWKEKWGNCVL